MNSLHPCPSQHSYLLPLIHTQFLLHKCDHGLVHPEPVLGGAMLITFLQLHLTVHFIRVGSAPRFAH